MRERMTVHKGLCELKLLADRIDKEINNATFLFTVKHGANKINGVPVTELAKQAQDKMKSITTLINRRNAIKRAIVNSNAVTKVTIGDNEYSVAEAIDMKANGLSYTQSLRSRIANQYAHCQRLIEQENQKLENRADEYVKATFGSAEVKNMSEEMEKARKTFVDAQTLEMIDAISAQKQIDSISDYADKFMAEVDSALSVSNALTTIEIEYEAT